MATGHGAESALVMSETIVSISDKENCIAIIYKEATRMGGFSFLRQSSHNKAKDLL